MNSTDHDRRPPQCFIRILMVEDASADVELSLRELRKSGLQVQVEVAITPEEFKQKLSEKSFDIVISDYRLPGWTGLEVLEVQRQLGFDQPLILVTGTLGEELAIDCIRRGVSDYVLKHQLARLPVAVRHALEERELRLQRARSEESLRQSEASFRLMFDANPLPMWVFDRNTFEFLEVNDAAVEHYGYSRAEFLKLKVTDIRPQADLKRLEDFLQNSATGGTLAGLWRHRTKAGREIDVDILCHPIQFNVHSGVLVVAQDVTEKRALAKQLQQAQKFEAFGQLAGGIAHDFNNMIGAILGWADLGLDETDPGARIHQRFEKIRQQALRAAALTRQLLAFARRQILEPRDMDLNQAVVETLSLLEKIIGGNIEISAALGPDTFVVRADPTQVEQVIMNLCLNSRDAMPNGGKLMIETRNITIDESFRAAHTRARPGKYVRLSVADTGSGMDVATLDRVFEPFFTTKEAGKGTGLGLATVYGIVEQHGGFIGVESEVGAGTTFRVFWPVSAAVVIEAPAKEDAPPAKGGSEVVLIAEDHDGLREIARETLDLLGYPVILARDGEEAVEKFRNNCDRIGLLLLDVVLPKLSGPEVYARISAEKPGIPVVFATGYSSDHSLIGKMSESGIPVLQKPYSPRDLARKVREALDSPRRQPVSISS
jgi:two-component system, cell cycle sensor histidine kinase and response regulator CckA